MRSLLLALALLAGFPSLALARPPMETNQLVDGDGVPIGTATNPLAVTGGGGGGSTGSVTPAGTNGTNAQSVQGIDGGVPITVTPRDGTLPWGTAGGTSSSSGSALGPGGVPTVIDKRGYSTVVVMVTGLTGGANVAFDVALNANGPWVSRVGTVTDNPGTAQDQIATGGVVTYEITAPEPYFRVRQAGGTAASAVVALSATPSPPRSLFIGGANPGTRIEGVPASSATTVGAPIAYTIGGVSLVGKASAGNLYGFSITAGGTAAYLALLNAAAVPANGAAITPFECIPVPVNGYVARRQDIPDRYPAGIIALATTSCTTYTAVAPQVMSLVVQ